MKRISFHYSLFFITKIYKKHGILNLFIQFYTIFSHLEKISYEKLSS